MITNEITIGELRAIMEKVEKERETITKEQWQELAFITQIEISRAGSRLPWNQSLQMATRIFALGKLHGAREAMEKVSKGKE